MRKSHEATCPYCFCTTELQLHEIFGGKDLDCAGCHRTLETNQWLLMSVIDDLVDDLEEMQSKVERLEDTVDSLERIAYE